MLPFHSMAGNDDAILRPQAANHQPWRRFDLQPDNVEDPGLDGIEAEETAGVGDAGEDEPTGRGVADVATIEMQGDAGQRMRLVR